MYPCWLRNEGYKYMNAKEYQIGFYIHSYQARGRWNGLLNSQGHIMSKLCAGQIVLWVHALIIKIIMEYSLTKVICDFCDIIEQYLSFPEICVMVCHEFYQFLLTPPPYLLNGLYSVHLFNHLMATFVNIAPHLLAWLISLFCGMCMFLVLTI